LESVSEGGHIAQHGFGAMYRWEDGKNHTLPQDFADMIGWKELAVKVDSICSELPNLAHTFIL
jgi:hypothetical protein